LPDGTPTCQYDNHIGTTISQLGCALTAETMVVDYLRGDQTTPTQTNPYPPSSFSPFDLNVWRDEFNENHDVDWDHAAFNYAGIVRLYPSATPLPSNFFPVLASTSDTLDNLLANGVPVILQIVDSAQKANVVHFIVITGKDVQHNTYFINDPGDITPRTFADLSANPPAWVAKDNACVQCSWSSNYFIVLAPIGKTITPGDPNTAAALAIHTNDPVDFILTDPQGRRTGFDPITNTSYQDIPASAYSTTIYRDEQAFSFVEPPLKALDMANQMSGQYTLNVIGTGSGAFNIEVRTSDAAGNLVIQTYAGTTSPGTSSHITFQGAVTAFSAFTPSLTITSASQSFRATGFFTLGTGGAISPTTQPLTLVLGRFLVTIPAGSFSMTRPGVFVFQGSVNGVPLAAQLTQLGTNRYNFQISGAGAPDLPSANPVDVRLAIGSNGGSASVNATFNP